VEPPPDPTSSADALLPMFKSRTIADLEVSAANPIVNNPRNQGPELL
jgi:hypothetical protein